MKLDKFKEQSKVWGPRVAFFAVFGFTGLAAIGLYKGYKTVKDKFMNEPLDLGGYEYEE